MIGLGIGMLVLSVATLILLMAATFGSESDFGWFCFVFCVISLLVLISCSIARVHDDISKLKLGSLISEASPK